MGAHILILLGNYKSYLEFFNAQNTLDNQTYDKHYEAFVSDCCGWNGAWVEPLKQQGFSVSEVFYNNTVLQNKWVAEQLIEDANLDPIDIVYEQIKVIKPEILFIDNVQLFDSAVIREIRKRFSFVKKVIAYIGTNHFSSSDLKDYDLIFCPVETYRKPIADLGIKAALLPHAFNSKVLEFTQQKSERTINKIMFAGGIVLGNDMHNDRLEHIQSLIENVPIDILSNIGNSSFTKELASGVFKKVVHETFNMLQNIGIDQKLLERIPRVGHFVKWDNYDIKFIDRSLKEACLEQKFGLGLFEEIQKYAAVFNMHIAQVNEAANMRLYEVTGIGGCLLTDEKKNLGQIFQLDHEVISYSSKEECIEKARWILDNLEEAKSIGRAAQKRVLRDHTFFNRAEVFTDQLAILL